MPSPIIKVKVGMLAAVCALCAAEAAVDSPAYENAISAVICGTCGAFGFYLSYENVKVAVAKSKGPVKGKIRKVRETLPDAG